jgi:branched-chain amino acid aminotransferase
MVTNTGKEGKPAAPSPSEPDNTAPLYVYLNGNVVVEEEAAVSIRDRGFLYGDAIFETLRSYDGRPFMLNEHLERLTASADALGFSTKHTLRTQEELRGAVTGLLESNKLRDAYIRITLSRGAGGLGLVPTPAETPCPTLVIETRPLRPYPENSYKQGVRLIISDYKRSTTNPAMRHKTANFLPAILARREAVKKGAQDALFLNTDGNVCEGTVWNFFMVEAGRVITPPVTANLLPGITRGIVLRLCGDAGIAASEEVFGAERISGADEAFITNSLMEIMPVASIDDHVIGADVPGEITRRLMDAYKELT